MTTMKKLTKLQVEMLKVYAADGYAAMRLRFPHNHFGPLFDKGAMEMYFAPGCNGVERITDLGRAIIAK